MLACSGGANVGQLANQAVVELTQEGFGKMFCLAGIGGQLSGFVQSAKDVARLVVIDGCDIGCAKAVLEKNHIPLRGYVVVTQLGIDKNKDFDLKPQEVQVVKEAARKAAQDQAPADTGAGSGSGCCG